MLSPEQQERIRRAYFIERLSMRQIARREGHARRTVEQVISHSLPRSPQPPHPRSAPVFGAFQAQVDALLERNDRLPKKQRLTSHKIFETIRAEGYAGCESRVRQYVAAWKQRHHPPEVYLPLTFEPGHDAQVDWGEALAIVSGVRQTIHLFVIRLCYSRRLFVMAFPTEKQSSFLLGHVHAFTHFGGVPARLSYDNLATAVKRSHDHTRTRTEHPTFIAFRSHYLFESHFCTPGQGHEKGGVESGVGFVRRNFLTPIPEVASFEELNALLLNRCIQDDQRTVARQTRTIGELWAEEQPVLRPLPPFAFPCCETVRARLNPYSQVTFETNRYSVPVTLGRRDVVIHAYPFQIEVVVDETVIARHPRCYGRHQDLLDPLHYLPLLEHRPGAFDYVQPIRTWRAAWPAAYHDLLASLRETWPDGRGVQEFVRILQLHQHYPADLIHRAIEDAMRYGCRHLDGVLYCLHQRLTPDPVPLDLSDRPDLATIGTQPIDVRRYEQLLNQSW